MPNDLRTSCKGVGEKRDCACGHKKTYVIFFSSLFSFEGNGQVAPDVWGTWCDFFVLFFFFRTIVCQMLCMTEWR